MPRHSAQFCLGVAAAVAPGFARAQAAAGPAAPGVRAPRLAFSLAGGLASGAPLGVSRQTAGHGLVAVGYAPPRFPAEVRADLMGVTWADRAGQVSLSASGVLPFGRAGLAGGVIRPYLLAGVGASGFRAGVPADLSLHGHAGGGVRFERAGYGAFTELRRHAAYRQSFLSVGATLRR